MDVKGYAKRLGMAIVGRDPQERKVEPPSTKSTAATIEHFLPHYQHPDYAVPDIDDLVQKQGLAPYREMVRRDDQVSSSLIVLKAGVLSSGWDVSPASSQPADEKVAAAFKKSLESVTEGSVERLLFDVLEAFDVGTSTVEKVYGKPWPSGHEFAGKVPFAKFRLVAQETVALKTDEFGEIEPDGVWQADPSRHYVPDALARDPSFFKKLRRKDFVVWALKRHQGTVLGASLLRAAWPWYFTKKETVQSWGKHLAAFGLPIPSLKTPKGTTRAQKQVLLDEIRNGLIERGIAYDNDHSVEFTDVSASAAATHGDLVDKCDRGIARAILLPSLLMENTSTGSRALGSTQQDSFVWILSMIRGFIETEVVAQQITRQWVDFNFGEKFDAPKFKFKEFDPGRVKVILDTFDRLIGWGVEVGHDTIRAATSVAAPKPGEPVAEAPTNPKSSMPSGDEEDDARPLDARAQKSGGRARMKESAA